MPVEVDYMAGVLHLRKTVLQGSLRRTRLRYPQLVLEPRDWAAGEPDHRSSAAAWSA